MALKVSLLQSEPLPDLYKFRYNVFFGELGALLSAEEIKRGYMADSLDMVAYNYGLYDGTVLVGALRIVDLEQLPSYEDIAKRYVLSPLISRFGLKAICHAGRLALAPSFRSGPALAQLIVKAFEDCCCRGIKAVVSDCSPYLLPLYEKLGYRRFGDAFNDPIYGLKLPILLLLNDLPHLSAIRSPFAAVAVRFPVDETIGRWFRTTYPEFHTDIGHLVNPGSHCLYLIAKLGGIDYLQQYDLFLELTSSEMQALFSKSVVLSAKPGDYLIRKGLKEQNIYFILQGIAEVLDESGLPMAQLGTGDVVGEMAFLTRSARLADVVVKEPIDCVLINAQTLKTLAITQPKLFAKIMRNIACILARRLHVATRDAHGLGCSELYRQGWDTEPVAHQRRAGG